MDYLKTLEKLNFSLIANEATELRREVDSAAEL